MTEKYNHTELVYDIEELIVKAEENNISRGRVINTLEETTEMLRHGTRIPKEDYE
jgi:hypothetical protein